MPAWLIREQLGEEMWQSYFKFCVIRNPFEKAISAYYHSKVLKTKEPARRPDCWSEDDPQRFEEWLEHDRLPTDRDVFCIDGRFALDDFIRYESLLPDMQRVCERLGVSWDVTRLPMFKAGFRPPEAAAERLYTFRSRELVAEVSEFELRYFGYAFPAPETKTNDLS